MSPGFLFMEGPRGQLLLDAEGAPSSWDQGFELRCRLRGLEAAAGPAFTARLSPEERDWLRTLPTRPAFFERAPGDATWIRHSPLHRDGRYAGTLLEWHPENEELALRQVRAELAKVRKEASAHAEQLGSLSHEIRNPLNSVLVMNRLLLDTELGAEQRDWAERIRVGGEAILSVVSGALDFAKIAAGRIDLVEKPIDLETVLEETLGLLAPQVEGRPIDLRMRADAGLPGKVLGDPGRLRQILLNLGGNALKFTERGLIELRAEPRREAGDRVEILFSVRDTGAGIPLSQWGKLFQAFSQLDAGRRQGGHGLGLAIVKKLVDRMGGNIWVQSLEGRGSTFFLTLWFPLLERHPESTPFAGRRVHLYDADEARAAALFESLKRHGLSGECSTSSALLLERARTGGPEILLVDASSLEGPPPPLLEGRIGILLGAASPVPGWIALSRPLRPTALLARLRDLEGGPAPAPRIDAVGPGKGEAWRILVADDDPDNRAVAKALFRKLGFEIRTAVDGQEAVDVAEGFDLIFLDWQMPRLDGIEAAKRIRAKWPKLHLVALTANARPQEKEIALAAGMDDFLSKPIDIDALKEILHRPRLGR